MSRKRENMGFTCSYCGKEVSALTNGSFRNHCPHCLYSLHVDITIGDRASNCLGQMKPIGLNYNNKKGYQIIHKCIKCGTEKVNKIALNSDMSDDYDLIIELVQKNL